MSGPAGGTQAATALWRRTLAARPGLVWFVAAGLVALVICGPWLAPNDPYHADILNRLSNPSLPYPLGTDAMGRCVLSRLLFGAQLTTMAAASVVIVAASVGTLVGIVAGYTGGLLDRLLMRIVEGISVLPALAVSLVVAGVLGLSLTAVIIALAAVHWTEYARVVRNVTMVERSKPYVMAAESIGAPGWRVILRHLLPNICGPLLVLTAYSLSWVILSFAGLSFLGLGVEPGTPEWGRMIAEARAHMRVHPRLVLAPGLTIMGFIIIVHLLADALADRWRVDLVTSSRFFVQDQRKQPMKLIRRVLLVLAATAATVAALPSWSSIAADRADMMIVGTMWEALPLAMAPRRSRFFNESEILDTLIKLDYEMNMVPGLATAWSRVSPTVWTFELRDGVTFHDGTPLDAAVVKNSLERVISLLPYAADLLGIKTITVKGPLEIEIETAEPYAALANQLTDAFTVIYAPSSFDADGKYVKPVGTGPWQLVDYLKQDRTIVERFDGYWGEAPALERIEYRFIPDHNARTLALETGEIDFAVNLPPADVARLKADEKFTVHAEPASGLFYGAFNTAGETPLADVRVRKALNLLVDRELVVTGALDGVGIPAWQFFGPQFSWAPEVEPYKVDKEAAAGLLEEAGYTKTDGKWMRDGKQLTLRILSYTSRTEMAAISEVLAALLAREGIASELQLFTWEGMLDLVRPGQYDISIVFWTPEMTGHPDLHLKSQFHSKAEMNYQGWANARFDELVDKGRGLDQGAEWEQTYKEALSILQDDAPIIPLVHSVFSAASTARLEGYRVHPSGFFYDFKSVNKAE